MSIRIILNLALIFGFLSCSFFEDEEFSYEVYSLEEFLNSDFENKQTNGVIFGTQKIEFKIVNSKVIAFVYMTSGRGIEYEPIIEFKDHDLFLSVKRTYNETSYEEEKVVYVFKYNLKINESQEINSVYFTSPNSR